MSAGPLHDDMRQRDIRLRLHSRVSQQEQRMKLVARFSVHVLLAVRCSRRQAHTPWRSRHSAGVKAAASVSNPPDLARTAPR